MKTNAIQGFTEAGCDSAIGFRATLKTGCTPAITLALASQLDRATVYKYRHQVYAQELGQHRINDSHQLRDALDDYNVYLVAKIQGQIAGFISITPPGRGPFSIDKYFSRADLPFKVDRKVYEVRLLTVQKPYRGRELATLLMYAAFRWVEAHGGEAIAAIGRREILDLYCKVGLEATGFSVQAGAVNYDLLYATIVKLRMRLRNYAGLLCQLEEKTDWQLSFPFRKPAACFHGGAFFTAVGEQFDDLNRAQNIINADVLDAWFPPAPRVLEALRCHLPWLLGTSPPTNCTGLIEAIAQARQLGPENVLPGAGSSDLIFRALRHWLTPRSHALILDPTYGEYAHVLEQVIGCTVDRLPLNREDNYVVPLEKLEAAMHDGYDLVVLVNPNSPTGQHVARPELARLFSEVPPQTRVWVDETYVEYAGAGQSLESFAVQTENVIVCKSMSKVYALSGARVAYLCAGAHQLEALRAITPPWVVSLPAQVAAVRALSDPEYYASRYAETAALREQLAEALRGLGWTVLPGIANYLLCHLPESGPDAESVVQGCRAQGLFIRNAALMGSALGSHAVRIAVKDAATNRRMIEMITSAIK